MERREPSVFISYSSRDDIFADLVSSKLSEGGIHVWRDHTMLRPGEHWRDGLERGIASSSAVLVVLSPNSAESAYVTYEWAYGLGKGKTVIPIKLKECIVHPRLATIQHIDFSTSRAMPWDLLIDRIHEVEATVDAILSYLNDKGFEMVSYEAVRDNINPHLTDEMLDDLISRNRRVLRHARLKGDRRGLGRRNP